MSRSHQTEEGGRRFIETPMHICQTIPPSSWKIELQVSRTSCCPQSRTHGHSSSSTCVRLSTFVLGPSFLLNFVAYPSVSLTVSSPFWIRTVLTGLSLFYSDSTVLYPFQSPFASLQLKTEYLS